MHDKNELLESESKSNNIEGQGCGLKGLFIALLLIGTLIYIILPMLGLPLLLYFLRNSHFNCNATGIGFPGMFLLPLLFIRKWKWPNFWRRDK